MLPLKVFFFIEQLLTGSMAFPNHFVCRCAVNPLSFGAKGGKVLSPYARATIKDRGSYSCFFSCLLSLPSAPRPQTGLKSGLYLEGRLGSLRGGDPGGRWFRGESPALIVNSAGGGSTESGFLDPPSEGDIIRSLVEDQS